jgi:hypothetical protein
MGTFPWTKYSNDIPNNMAHWAWHPSFSLKQVEEYYLVEGPGLASSASCFQGDKLFEFNDMSVFSQIAKDYKQVQY